MKSELLRSTSIVRVGLLTGVALLPSLAYSASTTVALDTSVTSTGNIVVGGLLSNTAPITASSNSGSLGQTITAVPGVADLVVSSNNTVSGMAVANSASHSSDLLLLSNDSGAGTAVSSSLLNSSLTSATAQSNSIALNLTNLNVGTATVAGNTFNASATGNTTSSSVSGEIPLAYSGTIAGSVTLADVFFLPYTVISADVIVAATQLNRPVAKVC